MLEAIIEALAGALAEIFATKAAQKGQARFARAYVWIVLGILLLIVVGETVFGIYLLRLQEYWVGALMLVIALFFLFLLFNTLRRFRRKRSSVSSAKKNPFPSDENPTDS